MEKVQINTLKKLLHGKTNIKTEGSFNSYGFSFLGKIMLYLMGIPRMDTQIGKVLFEIENTEKHKIWKRYFNGKLFKTYSNFDDYKFIEKKGLISFEFKLKEEDGRLDYLFQDMKIAGIIIPKIISLKPYAYSVLQTNDSWTFDIGICFLSYEPLVCYKGRVKLIK